LLPPSGSPDHPNTVVAMTTTTTTTSSYVPPSKMEEEDYGEKVGKFHEISINFPRAMSPPQR
jgi:hypothetical protein